MELPLHPFAGDRSVEFDCGRNTCMQILAQCKLLHLHCIVQFDLCYSRVDHILDTFLSNHWTLHQSTAYGKSKWFRSPNFNSILQLLVNESLAVFFWFIASFFIFFSSCDGVAAKLAFIIAGVNFSKFSYWRLRLIVILLEDPRLFRHGRFRIIGAHIVSVVPEWINDRLEHWMIHLTNSTSQSFHKNEKQLLPSVAMESWWRRTNVSNE